MSLAVDLFLVAVFSLAVYMGIRRGLVTPTLQVLRLLLSCAVTAWFGSLLSARLEAGILPLVTERMPQGLTAIPQVSSLLSQGLATLLSALLGYAILFFLSYFLLTQILRVVKRLTHLPVLKTLDRALGCVAGVAVGGLSLAIGSSLLRVILACVGREDVVEGSLLLSLFPGM